MNHGRNVPYGVCPDAGHRGRAAFVAPNLWRETFRRITQMSEGQIRFVGLTSMLIGVLLLWLLHG